MKTLALAVSILAASAAGASAADLAARPYTKAPPIVAAIYDWSGFYVGANGGYGSSRNCFASQPGGVVVNPVLGGFVAGDGGCHNATGGFGGGQIGYRWQSGAWVFGLEAQGDWAALSGSNLNATFGGAASGGIVDRTRVDGFGLFTGQVGYAWNSALLYVKGGAAVTRDRYDLFTTIPANVFTAAGSETRWGGAVGVGLEYGFAPNWSVGIEYDHLFMGTTNSTITYTGAGVIVAAGTLIGTQPFRTSQDVDLISARINYRFGGPVVAKY